MAERDDGISRRYRALAREEPPAALDAAILAASRRAVGARPGGVRRWAGPVSIAAVLVLGIGVSLRMQLERPGIETAPMSEYSLPAPVEAPEAPVEARPRAAPATSVEAPPTVTEKRAAPATDALAKPSAPRADTPSRDAAVMERRAPMRDPAPEPSRREEPPVAARVPSAPVAAQSAGAPAPAAAAGALAPQSPAAAASAPAMRAKRETAAGMNPQSSALDAAPDPRRVELERIARLRTEGLHGEADKALEEFQRTHRDYRIPEAMWERVRPR